MDVFISERKRAKIAYFLKMSKSALLDPANLKKRGTSVKKDALAVLTTFLKKFLKIFHQKSHFAFLYFSLGKSWILEGRNRQNASWTKMITSSLLFAPKWKCPFGLMFSLVEIDQKC